MEFIKGKYNSNISRVWRIGFMLIILPILYIVAVFFNFFWLFGGMPDLKAIENPNSQVASEIITADGQLLSKFFLENRTPIEFDQLSPNVVRALVATEDARFMKHSGIDPRSMFRVLKGLTGGGNSGGGSTLSQQLAKNLFETRSEKFKGTLGGFPIIKTVISKTKEWILAVRLERNYTKQEIMMMYLNTVSFGNNALGIRTAAKTYFNREPWNLDLHQAALLVGMLQNPSRFNPRIFPERSLERRNTVLAQMNKYGLIKEQDFIKTKQKTLGLKITIENHNTGPAPYFREALKDWMKDWLVEYNKDNSTDYDLYTSGLRIYTTIDSRMQLYAEDAATQNMKIQQLKLDNSVKLRKSTPWVIKKDKGYVEDPYFIKRSLRKCGRYIEMKRAGFGESTILKAMTTKVKMRVYSLRGDRDTLMSPLDSLKYYNSFLHTGMVSMEPQTGDVKAWVGGINFKHFKYDHVKQGARQPGSTFKPFVYTTAIDQNFVTPCTQIIDQQVCIGDWCPQNSNSRFSGRSLNLRQALGASVNSVSAYLMKQVGPKLVADYAHKIGITSPLPENDVTICLGTPSVTVFEMVNAYSTFANLGKHVEPRFVTRIEDKNGRLLAEFPVSEKEVISPSVAYQMLFIMQGAVQEGTAVSLKNKYNFIDKNEIAAKTGTTSDYTDAWFMGMTPNLVTGVWVGGEDNHVHFTNIQDGQGGHVALPAWAYYMKKVFDDPDLAGGVRSPYRKDRFRRPDGLEANLGCGGLRVDSTNTYFRPKINDDESVMF